MIYRIMVYFNGEWKCGLHEYETLEKAKERLKQLISVGIKAQICSNAEIFN